MRRFESSKVEVSQKIDIDRLMSFVICRIDVDRLWLTETCSGVGGDDVVSLLCCPFFLESVLAVSATKGTEFVM